MTTKAQMVSPSRVDCFTARRLKSEILKLAEKKDRRIHLWLKVWHQAKNLPDSLGRELEFIILQAMKCLKLSFQSGHRIFNEGICRGLGRTAMLLGAYLAERDLRKKRRENVQYTRVLEKMRDAINPNGYDDLNEEDKRVMEILKAEAEKEKRNTKRRK